MLEDGAPEGTTPLSGIVDGGATVDAANRDAAHHDASSGDSSAPDASDGAIVRPRDAAAEDAAVADASVDTGPACAPSCASGATTCIDGGVSTCTTDVVGCPLWGAAVACPAGASCVERGGSASCVVIAAPRPIAPLSTSTVTSHQPRFRWALAAGDDGAEVSVCRDRACTQPVTTFVASGTSGAPETALAPGVYYWRLRGMLNGVVGADAGVAWEIVVGPRSAPVNTSWGAMVDVNEDGFADVVVGAPYLNSLAGAVEVYLGSAAGLPASPVTITGGSGPFPELGFSVANAGDVNGDGFGDVIVGSPNGGGGAPGAAYVYSGGANGLAATPTVLAGPANHYYFGWSVSSAGDVNGDGYADVVVGGPAAGRAAGAYYLYLGSKDGISTASVTLGAAGVASVSAAGDVNGDGFGDIVVGDFSANRESGAAYVYLGGPNGLTAPITLAGTGPYAYFGYSVANAGDINGDGYADIVVGAPGEKPQIAVFTGGPNGPSTVPVIFADPSGSPPSLSFPNFDFGEAVASAGDVNGDGFTDVVVGVPIAGYYVGAAYVYFGSSSGLSNAPVALRRTGSSEFGEAVAGAGDVNGDGFGELLIGTPNADLGAGAAYVYWGAANGLSGAPASLTSPGARAGFGYSVAW